VIFVGEHCTLFNTGIQRCPSDSSIFVHEVEILILIAMPSGCFGFQYFSKLKLVSSRVLGFATLEKYEYGSILVIGHRRFAVVEQTVFMSSSRFQHAPAATSEYTWFNHLLVVQPESE